LGSNALAVGGNNLSTEVSGTIADGGASGGTGGSLVKVGNGILLLSGVNTYTGTTTVNSGALIVNGSIASSSLTTVNSGAVLLGSGTVGSTVVNAGGVLVPGAVRMPSSMTVAGDLIIQQCFLCRAGESVDGVAHHCDRHRVAGRHRRGRLLPGHLSRAQLHHFDGRQPAHRQVRRFGDVRPAAQLQGQAGLCRQHRRAQPEGAAHWRRRPISRSADIAAVDTGAAASAGGSARLSTATLHQQPDQRRTGDRQLLQQRRHHGRSGVGGTDHPALGFAPERETRPPDIALGYASAFKEPRPPAPPVHAPRWTASRGCYT